MEGNIATNNGGGLYIDKRDVILRPNGVIQIVSNKAVNGAGIYIGGTLDSTASFSVDESSVGNVIISDNVASGYGAAVCIDNGLFNLNSDNVSI
jgi:hypothetical protein